MSWRRRPAFTLIAKQDALRLTGLEPTELLRLTNTQQLTRIGEHGEREELVRIPVELLLEPPQDAEGG